MGREKISDSLIHHVDKAVAATIPSAHFKILQSSMPPHWGIHTPLRTKRREEPALCPRQPCR